MDLLVDPTVECVCLSGRAGVGKTLLALAAGLEQSSNETTYDRMKVARPTEAVTSELGHLPGTLEEKLMHWFKPIYDNIKFLFRDSKLGEMNGRRAYEHIQDHTPIDLMSLAHIRGRSIPDAYILVDEAQNTTQHEMKTIISRAGKGSKIVCTGDPYQIDNPYVDTYSNGLSYLIDRMQGLDLFGHVNLTKGERSELAEKATKRL
jgi:PhoH-like ATPase